MGLALTACGSSGGGTSTTDSGAKPAANDSAPVYPDDHNAWALKYTGGKAGAASGKPFKVGYVSQDTILPEATVGAKAAVAYINAQLGGIGGRPIQLVECQIVTPEDGQKCGTKLANDPDIKLVITGATTVGAKELYDAVQGKASVVIANAFSTEEFVTAVGVSYTSGLPGVFSGMATYIATDLKAKKVAVVLGDTQGGRASVAGKVKRRKRKEKR